MSAAEPRQPRETFQLRAAAWFLFFTSGLLFGLTSQYSPSGDPVLLALNVVGAVVAGVKGFDFDARSRGERTVWERLRRRGSEE